MFPSSGTPRLLLPYTARPTPNGHASMKKTAVTLALLLLACNAPARADDGLACLQDKVKVTAATVDAKHRFV